MSANDKTSGFARVTDGLASLTKDIATDLHAAYVGVFYGNGQISQPYMTSRSAEEQEAGISNVVGGTLQGLNKQLDGSSQDVHDRLNNMRNELSGRGEDGRDNKQDRGQGQERDR